ncbi:MAG: Gfo/Idh/MocA family oxidoreductase [Defluviitaleaceae bacterium]|nr:Gfo/Idh/MocA family oxidoreductase [Defluviitaleaceae bacterium]
MYRIGIVGFGSMGHQHFAALLKYDRAQVIGVFDPCPERVGLAESLGLLAYPSAEALFADPKIDIAIIASTNNLHKDHSINALGAGKHIICEKPATITSTELLEVIDVAQKNGKFFTINQNRRWDKDFLLMKEHIESGLLGRVYTIESRVHNSFGIPKGWRNAKDMGGGMMLDWGVHLIDQILHMTDKVVTNVFCRMNHLHYPDVEDDFKLFLTFCCGLTAQIEVGTNNFAALPRWYVLGKQGTLQVDDWDCRGKIVIQTQTIQIPGTANARSHKYLNAVYSQLLDAIEGAAELKITPHQALRVMRTIEAAFLSSNTKSALEVSI